MGLIFVGIIISSLVFLDFKKLDYEDRDEAFSIAKDIIVNVTGSWHGSVDQLLFDENYNKVILNEKIFIGGRIRDLEYHNKMNAILLSLEQTGELGIITKE